MTLVTYQSLVGNNKGDLDDLGDKSFFWLFLSREDTSVIYKLVTTYSAESGLSPSGHIRFVWFNIVCSIKTKSE